MSRRTRCNPHAVLAFPALLMLGLVPMAQGAVHLTDATLGVDGQLFGTAVRALEDLNGDGRWELLVGAPESDITAGNKAGSAFLWLGGRDLTVAPDRVWHGVADDEFGYSLAAVGDVNHDGRPDWAVGAPARGTTRPGRIYVFYGAATPPTSPALTINGATANDQFGFSVAAAGDFDGDGIDDLVVGAPYADVNGTDNGAAYVIYGAVGGPSTNLADATVLRGSFADDHFGWAVCGAGNFLGGTARAVAVGAPDNNTRGMDAGAVYVYEGALGGAVPDTTIDHWLSTSYGSNPAGGRFGYAVRDAGRWDGDGYDDLAIGAPEMNAGASRNGRVEIVFGDPSPSSAGDRYANGANAGDRFGWAVAGVRDVTGSSADDLLIGAPQRDFEASNAGRAYLWAGGSASQSSAAGLTVVAEQPLMPGTEADDQFGWAVASAGDFDGDGTWDLAVGAPYGNIFSNATAGFCLVVDSSGQAVANLLSRWKAAWLPEGGVGLDFALGLPMADISRLEVVRRGGGAGDVVYTGTPYGDGDVLVRARDGFLVRDEGAPATAGFTYELTLTLGDGSTRTLASLAGPADAAPRLPEGLALGDIWPNPANPRVSIRFRAEAGESVACRIYDLRGRLVRTVHAGVATGDWQTVQWDGTADRGGAAPSGNYLVLLQADSGARARRLTLAR